MTAEVDMNGGAAGEVSVPPKDLPNGNANADAGFVFANGCGNGIKDRNDAVSSDPAQTDLNSGSSVAVVESKLFNDKPVVESPELGVESEIYQVKKNGEENIAILHFEQKQGSPVLVDEVTDGEVDRENEVSDSTNGEVLPENQGVGENLNLEVDTELVIIESANDDQPQDSTDQHTPQHVEPEPIEIEIVESMPSFVTDAADLPVEPDCENENDAPDVSGEILEPNSAEEVKVYLDESASCPDGDLKLELEGVGGSAADDGGPGLDTGHTQDVIPVTIDSLNVDASLEETPIHDSFSSPVVVSENVLIENGKSVFDSSVSTVSNIEPKVTKGVAEDAENGPVGNETVSIGLNKDAVSENGLNKDAGSEIRLNKDAGSEIGLNKDAGSENGLNNHAGSKAEANVLSHSNFSEERVSTSPNDPSIEPKVPEGVAETEVELEKASTFPTVESSMDAEVPEGDSNMELKVPEGVDCQSITVDNAELEDRTDDDLPLERGFISESGAQNGSFCIPVHIENGNIQFTGEDSDDKKCHQVEAIDGIHRDQAPTSTPESSVAASEAQNVSTEAVVASEAQNVSTEAVAESEAQNVSTGAMVASETQNFQNVAASEAQNVGSDAVADSESQNVGGDAVAASEAQNVGTEEVAASEVQKLGSEAVAASEDRNVGNEAVAASESRNVGSEAVAASESQNVCTEVVKRPFYFLIKVPKFEDDNLNEQIKLFQLKLDEKTRSRDAIQDTLHMRKASFKEFVENLEAAKSEEKTAREMLKPKCQERDSLRSVINKVKIANSVEDIDGRICQKKHTIEHETLSLKEEKQLIREINQLEQDRKQLFSSIGKQDEIQQAFDQKEQIEELSKALQVLWKEVDSLGKNVSKAEAATWTAKKKCDDESEKLWELDAQCRAANVTRQEAYKNLKSLKNQRKDKNKYHYNYKDAVKAANDLLWTRGDKEALQNICDNQVERFMEMWNNNAEFRKEYVRCNVNSTLKRLKTLDGRSLGPNEEPPVIRSVQINRVARESSASQISTVKEEKPERVVPVKTEKENKSMAKVGVQKDQAAKSQRPAKPALLENGSATVSGRNEIEETREEEPKRTKEEEELARKAEGLRKEEEAAKLREQLLLEQKVKAKEALERKKRNDEKARARAEVRAQKEAEQKEKEREKRKRKKDKKKAVGTENTSVTNEEESGPSTETLTVGEIKKDKCTTVTKKALTKQSKSIPLPIRNRGKRRMKSWMWVVIAALVGLALFVLGNSGLSFKSGLQW